ncbi:MAG: YihY/virulence factor BrkB family protein [Acidimicrobiales bacterium]
MARTGTAGKLDSAQKRYRPTGVAVGTLKKFLEDGSSYMAAMIAFWAFFSVFPLFLLLMSLLGYLLPASTKSDVLHHVAALFPMLDPSTVGHLSGSAWTAILGGVTALWSGTAVMRTAQYAFNSAWEVPMRERPKMVEKLKRALFALSTIGVGLVVSVIISDFVTGRDNGVDLGMGGRIAGYVVAAALDVGLFVVAFKVLTDRKVSFRDVLPGAVLSGVAFWVLEQLSSFIISRHLQNAQSTYGHFATVITILWWFYIQAVITMLGAQLNVVLRRRLYPRSLSDPTETGADRRALRDYAASRAYAGEGQQEVQVHFPGRRGDEEERDRRDEPAIYYEDRRRRAR